MEFGRRTPEAGSAGPAAAATPRPSCILKLSLDRWFTSVYEYGREKFIYYLR